MKKTSWKFVSSEILVTVTVSILGGIIIAVVGDFKDVATGGIQLGIMLLIFSVIFRIVFGNVIADKLAERTMDKLSDEEFYDGGTFYSAGCIIRIDTVIGRIAYVSSGNPFEVQIVSAKDISEIKTYCNEGTLGGTRYVAFQFLYQNRNFRFPTFVSRQTYSMDSEEVQNGMDKAEEYCERLRRAQSRALMDDVS